MGYDCIAVLNLGGENNTDVARFIRSLNVYSEIFDYDVTLETLSQNRNLKGIVINCSEQYPNLTLDGSVISSSVPMLVVGATQLTLPNAQKVDQWPQNIQSLLKPFVESCKAQTDWTIQHFIDDQVEQVRNQVGQGQVLLALSGGVDSSVLASLLHKAIGDRLVCVHVNHGLLRQGEPEQVVQVFKENMGVRLVYVDATERFLNKLEGVSEPEQKRKIIGEEFIRVFEEEANKLNGVEFLAQGTIYPDILESASKLSKGIKAHHNVGGLPENMKFKLVEPLAQLFKDEVRAVGDALGLPHDMVYRQPFPGPGLGVRCTGAITRDRLASLRHADFILREMFKSHGLDQKVWQYFTVVPDCKTVGVREGKRSYEYPVIIRAVNTVDAVTANPVNLDWDFLQAVTHRILAEVPGVNRVCYDMSPKPPGTIEWE